MNKIAESDRSARPSTDIAAGRIAARGRWDWAFYWLGLVGLAGLALAPRMAASPPAAICYYAAVAVILLVAVAGRRYRAGGIGDPVLLFALIFGVYTIGLLIEFGYQALEGKWDFQFFGGNYGVDDIAATARFTALAAAGLCAGAFVLPRRPARSRPLLHPRDAARLFATGAVCLVAVMLSTVLIVVSTVGMTAFLAAVRTGGERINPSTALGIGIPLGPFAIAGIACMLAGLFAAPVRRRILLFILVAAAFAAFNFAQGVRHLVAYMAIMFLGACATFIQMSRGQLIKLALGALVVYALFAFVSGIRWILPEYFGGGVSRGEVIETAKSFSRSGLLPSQNEFIGPYFTVLDTWSHPSAPARGGTYAGAVLALLPTSLYPGVKPIGLARDFAAEIGRRVPSLRGTGFGFSPVAEALVNFGARGIPVVFIAWAFVWHAAGALRRRRLFGILAYLVILAQVLNANRYSLNGVLQEAVYSVAAVYLLYRIGRRRAT